MNRLPRLLLSLLLCGLPVAGAWGQTTVTRTPGTCASVAGPNGLPWTNPANAQTAGATGATRSINDGEVSDYLQCSNYGFTIPDGNRVTGITATLRRLASNNNVQDNTVVLLRAGTREATNLATTTTYNGSYRDDAYGGTTNLWGAQWSTNDINVTGFGLALAAQKSDTNGGGRTVNVDVISLAVTYVADATAPAVSSINRVDIDPTNGAGSVSWTVTFSEAVTGVNAFDFRPVEAGGVSGALITAVTGSGTSWTVTASTGSGTGTLGLNLVDDDSIRDLANNRLGGTGAGNGNFTIGQTYTVSAFVCNPPSNIPVGVTVSCVCDNFNRASLNPSTIFGQDWITTISDNTGIQPSIVDNSVLRLTNNTAANAKAATLPAAFPAAGNYISVDFLFYGYNGSGADGIAVTLSDYNASAVPGAFGGSLGYAPKSNPGSDCTVAGGCPGFAGGWIGVGLDEFGNYQSATEGRTGGATPAGARPDSVGVRGSGAGQTGYRWLDGTAANLSPGIDIAGATRGPGHRYQVVVDARNASATTPQTFVAVNRDTSGVGNSYTPLVPSFDAFARALALYPGNPQAPVPANWQISFTGSTGGSNNIHEIDSLRICAQTVVPPTRGVASGFAVIDEAYGTPAIAVGNYLTGRIYTKLAGTSFKLNVAAVNNNQIQTGYVLGTATKNVNVKLVNNSDGDCVLNSAQANYCSATCQTKPAVTDGSQTLTFTSANAGQRQSTDFTVSGAWSNLVALVSDGTTINANGVWACATDAFAVRPQVFNSLSITATNSGTPPLRASTDPFTMTVGTLTDGYAGAAALPTINPAGVAADAAGWTVGSITPGSFPLATSPGTDSSATRSTFTYSEVGQFRLLGYDPATDTTSTRGVYDSTWTAVDQGTQLDCISVSYANTRDTSGTFASNTNFGKYGCLFGLGTSSALFGRFIPDRFMLTSGSVTSACNDTNPATLAFTYLGQARLGIAYRLEARNGANGITQNYDATRVAGVAPTLVAEDQDVANQSCNLATRLTGTPTAAWAAGVYNATTATAVFSRPAIATPGTLNASTPALCTATLANAGNPFWNLDIGVLVNDGSASMTGANMNAASTGVCSGAGCNAIRVGSTGMLLGRLNLLNAYGSDALPLLVPVRAEYWNGTTWQLNTDDRCTIIATAFPSASPLAVGNVVPATAPPLNVLNVTNASISMSPSATLNNGTTNFRITPITPGPGSVDVVLNLGFGVSSTAPDLDWCGSWPTTGTQPATNTGVMPSPDLSFLAGNWCGSNADRAPAARIRFGSPKAPFIYLRERY